MNATRTTLRIAALASSVTLAGLYVAWRTIADSPPAATASAAQPAAARREDPLLMSSSKDPYAIFGREANTLFPAASSGDADAEPADRVDLEPNVAPDPRHLDSHLDPARLEFLGASERDREATPFQSFHDRHPIEDPPPIRERAHDVPFAREGFERLRQRLEAQEREIANAMRQSTFPDLDFLDEPAPASIEEDPGFRYRPERNASPERWDLQRAGEGKPQLDPLPEEPRVLFPGSKSTVITITDFWTRARDRGAERSEALLTPTPPPVDAENPLLLNSRPAVR